MADDTTTNGIYTINGDSYYVGQDIPLIPVDNADDNTTYGSDVPSDVKELQVGIGDTVFRADQSGIWLGAATFADAPFSVDMQGNVIANNITLGGYVPTGGAAADVNSGSTTVNGGQLTAGTVTAAKISVTSLSAISANIGTITAGTITGLTITGGIVRTSATGFLVQLNGTTDALEFLNGTTIYGSIFPQFYPTGNGLRLESSSTGAEIELIEGSTINHAYIGFDGDGLFVDAGGTAEFSVPVTFDDDLIITNGSNFDYNGVNQPRLFWGYCSGTSISPTNSAFTMTHPSTGNYTITHSRGHTNYVMMVTAVRGIGSGAYTAKVTVISTNTVQIGLFNDSGTSVDSDFQFLLAENQ